jgi:hypothetical protein
MMTSVAQAATLGFGMDDAPLPSSTRSPARMSRTPSWVLLGFGLGVLFMWLLPRDEPPPPPAPARAPAHAKPAEPAHRRISDVEAVFELWGRYAVWDQNRTEVALWSPSVNAYADFYEVLREEDTLWFRSIPKLTRPLIAHATKTDAPMIFTETAEMRRAWLESRAEMRPAQALPPAPAPEPTPAAGAEKGRP